MNLNVFKRFIDFEYVEYNESNKITLEERKRYHYKDLQYCDSKEVRKFIKDDDSIWWSKGCPEFYFCFKKSFRSDRAGKRLRKSGIYKKSKCLRN